MSSPDRAAVLAERRRRRDAALAGDRAPADWTPRGPAGHAGGRRVSESVTSTFRETRYHGRSMDVKPSEVTAVLRQAGVRRWVLMGLHGYVGYLPEPRATQDVDVLVDHHDRAAAVHAIGDRWPTLEAALAAKYAAMVSPNRQPAEKAFDAGDFRNLVLSNADRIDPDELTRLAELVMGGGDRRHPRPDRRGKDWSAVRTMTAGGSPASSAPRRTPL